MEPGQILSRRYRLLCRLAQGGMGEVWAARNERTRGEVAIKVLLPSLARSSEAWGRFGREARAAGRLAHPGIVRVFDAGKTDDGRPYLVMELLHGESLADRLARTPRIDPLEAVVLLAQVARAVAFAHEHGVIHRDLSTANIFLTHPDGGAPLPRILDFGVSKIAPEHDEHGVFTLSGSLLGSPAYMSPEQASGADRIDARSDVWSLGVLLYQCLSGHLPFVGRNQNSTMVAVITRPHQPLSAREPNLDPDLSALVDRCLEKDVERRLPSAAMFADTLERIGRRLAERVSDSQAVTRLGPRRRLTDRLPDPPATRSLVPVLRTMAATIAGLALGLALGSRFAPRKEPRSAAAPASVAPVPSRRPPSALARATARTP